MNKVRKLETQILTEGTEVWGAIKELAGIVGELVTEVNSLSKSRDWTHDMMESSLDRDKRVLDRLEALESEVNRLSKCDMKDCYLVRPTNVGTPTESYWCKTHNRPFFPDTVEQPKEEPDPSDEVLEAANEFRIATDAIKADRQRIVEELKKSMYEVPDRETSIFNEGIATAIEIVENRDE